MVPFEYANQIELDKRNELLGDDKERVKQEHKNWFTNLHLV